MIKNMTVEDLMDRVFISFNPKTSLTDAVSILGDKRLFGACVVDGEGKVLGILSEKKCIRLYRDALAKNSSELLETLTVMDIVYTDFITIEKTASIVDVAQVFLNHDFRRLPVIESGRLIGQITRRDIIRAIELVTI